MDILHILTNYLTASIWPPYLVGVGIGILCWLTFFLSDHPIGVSTAFAKSAGMIEKAVRGPEVHKKPYYQEHIPKIDWGWMLVAGLFLGAFTAAWVSGDINWKWVPQMWEDTFGPGILLRLTAALFGGVCVGFGARWGSGCTSGHGISGTLQLVLSSWIAVFRFFFSGIAVALFIYRGYIGGR